jgi:hypothetical protein
MAIYSGFSFPLKMVMFNSKLLVYQRVIATFWSTVLQRKIGFWSWFPEFCVRFLNFWSRKYLKLMENNQLQYRPGFCTLRPTEGSGFENAVSLALNLVSTEAPRQGLKAPIPKDLRNERSKNSASRTYGRSSIQKASPTKGASQLLHGWEPYYKPVFRNISVICIYIYISYTYIYISYTYIYMS